jgi:hypothetical protein
MKIKLYAISFFLAPFLHFLSSFFWLPNGQYNVTGGTLIILGSVFWIFVFQCLFESLSDKTPRYAVLGWLFAVYGCLCGGVAFGLEGIFADIFNISHQTMLEGLGRHPLMANVIFWVGGPAFPVSVLILGIVLTRTKMVASWVGITFALAGLLFPLSRIPRNELIAHVVDVFMLIPLIYLSLQLLQNGKLRTDI